MRSFSPNSVRIVALIALGACGPAQAQMAFDIPLPAGVPSVLEGPAFTAPGALAVCGAGSIHSWTGLPHAPSHQVLTPGGSLAMAGRWHRFSKAKACYRAVGFDLSPDTPDDVLVLVTGLPAQPALVPTGILDPDPAFDPVNETTAVRTVPGGFLVLRHDASGVTAVPVATGHPMATGPGWSPGAISTDAYAAWGAGPDGLNGTPDDQLVVMSGLDGTSWPVASWPVTTGAAAAGFVVSASGVPAYWEPNALPTLRLVVVRNAVNLPVFGTYTVTPPASPSPATTPAFGVRRGVGDSLVAWCADDVGPGTGHALVTGLSTGSTIQAGTWYDDWNCGCTSSVVGERDVATWSAAGATSFTYSNFPGGPPVSFSFAQPWTDTLLFRKSHAGSLVACSDLNSGGSWLAQATVFTNVTGAFGSVTFSAAGRWAGGGFGVEGEYWGPRVEVLSPGMVAAFLTPSYGSAAPATLRILTTPGAVRVGRALATGATPVGIATTLPTAVTPLRFDVTVPASWTGTEGWFAVTRGLRSPALQVPAPPFALGSSVHLDFANLVGVLQFQYANGQAALSFPAGAALAPLAGLDFYFQAMGFDGASTFHLSDAFLLVLS